MDGHNAFTPFFKIKNIFNKFQLIEWNLFESTKIIIKIIINEIRLIWKCHIGTMFFTTWQFDVVGLSHLPTWVQPVISAYGKDTLGQCGAHLVLPRTMFNPLTHAEPTCAQHGLVSWIRAMSMETGLNFSYHFLLQFLKTIINNNWKNWLNGLHFQSFDESDFGMFRRNYVIQLTTIQF